MIIINIQESFELHCNFNKYQYKITYDIIGYLLEYMICINQNYWKRSIIENVDYKIVICPINF